MKAKLYEKPSVVVDFIAAEDILTASIQLYGDLMEISWNLEEF